MAASPGRIVVVAVLLVAESLHGIAGVSSYADRRPRYPDVELHPAVASAFFKWNLGRQFPTVSSMS